MQLSIKRQSYQPSPKVLVIVTYFLKIIVFLSNSIEPIHTVIIDCAPIGFMDAVGVKTMQQVQERL